MPEMSDEIATAQLSVIKPDDVVEVPWDQRPERKIAIVGFTTSRDLAPWKDPSFELWICNNLWKFVPDVWHRLYDLHDDKTIQSDPEHAAYLTQAQKPVVVWRSRPEWPSSISYPKDVVTENLGRYFTNSISWMIAHAIIEGATEIHVYGVDMAQGTEYAAQRPSCEYFLGLAVGMGIRVHVPDTSDLLKANAMYGAEDDSALYAKLNDREQELIQRMTDLQNQLQAANVQFAQLQGALETTRYFKTTWTNPRAQRTGDEQLVPINTEG